MKTSWNDIALIERYLDENLNDEETKSFEDRLACDATFKINVLAQTQVRALVKKHYLIHMRQQAKILHVKLYNDPARRPLRQALEALFKH